MKTLILCVVLVSGAARAEFVTMRAINEAGEPTAVRMEIRGDDKKSHVPDSALSVQMKCSSQPVPDEAPGCMTGFSAWNYIENPHTGTRQFYVDRPFEIDLPPGHYVITASKGIEYLVARVDFDVVPFERDQVTLQLKRWSNLSHKGWFSADDHLHLERLSPSDDEHLTKWMQAEDINVGNLIQMGSQQAFDMAAQYAFGDAGAYLSGSTLILSGQEHPRTHFLGHSLILGAGEAIDARDTYSVYDNFFKLARKLGGVNGYAHWGLGAGENGLAIDAPRRLLSFVEVLQFEYPHYAVWYELLNLGIPMAPTAGTDFPCGPWSVPGRERFYTKVDGKLSRQSWLEGVRRGRTFVTNGPLLEFQIDNAEIGDQLTLKRAGKVRVRAKVSFDPSRDKLDQIMLVRNGVASALVTRKTAPGVLEVDVRVPIEQSAWFALRASGTKIGEAPLTAQPHSEFEYTVASSFGAGLSMKEREAFAGAQQVRPAEAHTGAIYVDVSGTTPVSRQPRSQVIARAWLTRLDALEAQLRDENIQNVPLKLGAVSNSDSVDLNDLLGNRKELLVLIAFARSYFQALTD